MENKKSKLEILEESFLNFCIAMQCAKVSHNDVILILKELSFVAEDNGFNKDVLEAMLTKLMEKH